VASLLRRAAAGDAPALLLLAREMGVSGAGQGVPEDDADGSTWAAGWIRGHTQEGRLMLVAEVDGRAAGFAAASAGPSPTLSHVAQLSLFVSAACRRQGIGRQLLDGLIQWAARSPGIDKLQLAVQASNKTAIGLYRRCGFRQEGRLRGQVRRADGTRVDQLLMARGVDRASTAASPAPPPGPAACADRVCLERDLRFGDSLL
jgi:ribosomal protein S18 acetylase RimI-like enzyme